MKVSTSTLTTTAFQVGLTRFTKSCIEVPGGRYRILIASVQILFRECLKSSLESQRECEIALEADNLSQVARAIYLRTVDIVLLDSDLVEPMEVKFLRRPGIVESRIPFLIMSSLSNRFLVKELLVAGAAGVIAKCSSMQDLKTGIRLALERKTWRDCRALCLRERTRSITPSASSNFTERQNKVIQGVLQGRANKEIASDLSVSEASVKSTMRQLFSKTKTHSRAQLAMALMDQSAAERLQNQLFRSSRPGLRRIGAQRRPDLSNRQHLRARFNSPSLSVWALPWPA